jgi:hypothetical protein
MKGRYCVLILLFNCLWYDCYVAQVRFMAWNFIKVGKKSFKYGTFVQCWRFFIHVYQQQPLGYTNAQEWMRDEILYLLIFSLSAVETLVQRKIIKGITSYFWTIVTHKNFKHTPFSVSLLVLFIYNKSGGWKRANVGSIMFGPISTKCGIEDNKNWHNNHNCDCYWHSN